MKPKPKTAKKIQRKKPKPKPKTVEVVDTEYYTVESVVDSKLDGREILYSVKWKDYTETTWEPECRLYCQKTLVAYAKTVLDTEKYVAELENNLESMHASSIKWTLFKEVFDPMAIVGMASVLGGSVKFVHSDTFGTKLAYLRYIINYNQQHVLHSLKFPKFKIIHPDFTEYRKQLNCIDQLFDDSPHVSMYFPIKKCTTFYSPPPLTSLLFEPITAGMMANRESFPYHLPPKSDKTSFNDVKVLIDPDFIKPDLREQMDDEKYKGMTRKRYSVNSRFANSLEMRQEEGIGWKLTVGHMVKANSPLLMLTGVIRHRSAALESLQAEGEEVAFSSFIEIPGTEYCLDRRKFYDFSKYIPHSCNPTCSIRLVESGNAVPDLVLYSLVPINGSHPRTISLDYFGGFKADVDKYFLRRRPPDGRVFSLYEAGIDFVHCHCFNECREVLYIDKSTRYKDKKATKSEKLSTLDDNFDFGGMKLAESDKIWRIWNREFIESK